MTGLMIGEIVRRLRLNPRTAKYVLGKAESLRIAPGTGQGQHRTFNHEESISLALCTQMVMAGTPLKSALQVTLSCLKYERRLRRKHSRYAFDEKTPHEWLIKIYDTTIYWIGRRKPAGETLFMDTEVYWRAINGKKADSYEEVYPESVVVIINASAVAWTLATTTQLFDVN